jgi:hypothetical protein
MRQWISWSNNNHGRRYRICCTRSISFMLSSYFVWYCSMFVVNMEFKSLSVKLG